MTNEHTQEKHTPRKRPVQYSYDFDKGEIVDIDGNRANTGEVLTKANAYPHLVEALEAFILATDNHPSPAAREHYLPLIVKAQAALKHTEA